MIIGFAGRKQVGKSTAALQLVDAGFIRYSFAETLKLMANVLLVQLGLSAADIRAAYADKERVIESLGVSLRHLLQTLGTDWGRQQIHSDLWLLCARAFFEQSRGLDVVIDDVRFENEAALIREMGGMIIHLRRGDSEGHDEHVSEAGIAVKPGDNVVGNHRDIDDLHRLVWMVVSDRVNALASLE